MARMSGNEFSALEAFAQADDRNPREALHAIFAAGRGQGVARRTRGIVANAVGGKKFGEYVVRADCEASARFARRFGMGPGMIAILDQAYERWDGKGAPRGLRGEEISPGARILAVALQAEVFHRVHGRDAAKEMGRRRSGDWFDPACAHALDRCAAESFERIERGSVWDDVLAEEPPPRVTIGERAVDDLAEGFADFADLKSAFTSQHSRRLASLAADAAQRCGLDQPTVALLRRAGLVHDVGRVSISAGVWDRPGPLRDAELEQVHLHAYHTERVLRRAGSLAAAGALAGLHHERLDGSGYHRGAHAATLPAAARILGAADAFVAMTEPRAYRAALAPEQAADVLQAEATAGRLDREAVRSVLEAAGYALRLRRGRWPAGLSDREVQVLGLLARGLSMKEIAQRLVVSPKTVDHHVQHIYTKIDVRTRPAARLFAIEHGLCYEGPL
jgi:HD-GYP domain-containing protein (c-di-GMP phosphodiesterase class II)